MYVNSLLPLQVLLIANYLDHLVIYWLLQCVQAHEKLKMNMNARFYRQRQQWRLMPETVYAVYYLGAWPRS